MVNYIIKDIDAFFKCRRLDEYMNGHKGYIAGGCFKDIFQNKNTKKKKIELVRSRFAPAEEMIRKFDFTIVKFAYYKEYDGNEVSWKFMYYPSFFEDLTNKKLVIDDTSSFPINTFERTYKYRNYGFGMCRESKKKLIELLQGVNTEDLSRDLYFGFD